MVGLIKLKNQSGQKAAFVHKNDGTLVRMSELGITDLNTLRTSGRFAITTSCDNVPCPGWLFIDVWVFNQNDFVQEVLAINSRKKYIRACANGTWSSWTEE